MLMKGFKFANIDEVIVCVSAGDDMYERQGGLTYAKQEIKMQTEFYKLGFISAFQLLRNLMIRVPVRVIPSKLRGLIYTNFLRQ